MFLSEKPCFSSAVGVLGAEPLGERVAEALAMILKRRCPFGDGHDRFRAKARARGSLPPYQFDMNFSRIPNH